LRRPWAILASRFLRNPANPGAKRRFEPQLAQPDLPSPKPAGMMAPRVKFPTAARARVRGMRQARAAVENSQRAVHHLSSPKFCPAKRRQLSVSDDLRPEYRFDYSKAVRGKYYRTILKEGANVAVLEPDVAKAFPNSAAVNDALRIVLNARRAARRSGARPARTRARLSRNG